MLNCSAFAANSPKNHNFSDPLTSAFTSCLTKRDMNVKQMSLASKVPKECIKQYVTSPISQEPPRTFGVSSQSNNFFF